MEAPPRGSGLCRSPLETPPRGSGLCRSPLGNSNRSTISQRSTQPQPSVHPGSIQGGEEGKNVFLEGEEMISSQTQNEAP